MGSRNIIRGILVLWLSCAAAGSLGQQAVHISELSKLDREFMAQQVQLLQDLAATKLGRRFSGDRDRDLDLLQTLLDRQLVRSNQVRELQAMGVVMGNLLAAELEMHWVIYEDNQGRSRALRYKNSDNYLFPITMIARRREVGNQTPVIDIYQKAYDIIDRSRPALPFR
jgi:hypothetical protein